MRLFNKINRCIKITNFYREFVNDVKSLRNPSKVIALNIIGCGAPGESASVSLSVSNRDKYLFNCGEDCQRLLANQKRKTTRIEHIFVTQTKWNCIGGISCIAWIINNAKRCFPMFHGPKQLYKCLKRIICLSILGQLDFKPIDCNLTNFFEDDTIRIEFISTEVSFAAKKEFRLRDTNEVMAFVGEVKATSDANDSKDKSDSSTRFLILDLPTKEHLKAFIGKQNRRYREKPFEIVVHFSPEHVTNLHEYKTLVSDLESKKHIYLNESNKCSRLRSVYELQAKLNQIDEIIHPPLKMPLDTSKTGNATNLNSVYYLKGSDSLDNKVDQELNLFDFQQSLDIDHMKHFPKVIFLGTASAMASPKRNNTSILLHSTRDKSMLIDCGEGTCSQIHRLYGKNAPQIIQNIKGVFISHLHYDHHGGLVELMRMRSKYMPSDRQPLMVLAAKADIKSWLFFYDTNIEAIHDDLYLIDIANLSNGLSDMMCKKLGVNMLRTCPVPHFNLSHALTLTVGDRDPFKLTFSSDTPPCDDLISLGRDSTLLIHEATYPDELSHKAEKNRHSTLSQAIEQSRKMNAKYTILTHSSQIQTIPIIDSAKNKNIGIAFDFMEITEKHLPKLGTLNEKYQKLFNENFRRKTKKQLKNKKKSD